MNNINVGDVIVFSMGDGLKSNVGLILKHREDGNYVVLTSFNAAYKNIQPDWIAPLDQIETVRKEIIEKYAKEINELQGKIREVTNEEKNAEKIEKYQKLKDDIKVTAKRLSESTDDTDFENRLKAISDMKKCIFSIKLECVSDIRKENGKLKYQIRHLEQDRDYDLDKISDENINKSFDF